MHTLFQTWTALQSEWMPGQGWRYSRSSTQSVMLSPVDPAIHKRVWEPRHDLSWVGEGCAVASGCVTEIDFAALKARDKT